MSQHEAKYKILVNWIKEQMERGGMKEGQKLYSENELSGMFGLSRQTVRHAISILETEGLVYRIQGSGTYVGSGKKFRRRRYMNIAVISTYVDAYIFPPTLQGIVRTLDEKGYMTQMSFSNNRVSDERRILQGILERNNVDGLIVEAVKSALPNPNLEYYRELQQKDVPILFFNCKYPDLEAPLVALDDEKVAEKAMEYLLGQGHRKIAGIFKSDDGQGALRYKGYIASLIKAGLEVDDRRILWIDTEDQKNLKNIRPSLLRHLMDCTAVFCYNDGIAFPIMEILQEEGIRIPEQFSMISIDGAEQYLATERKITTIPHPMEELGIMAATNLLRLLDEPDFDASYLYCPDILVRGSVRKIGG